jgi:hypothetical protein
MVSSAIPLSILLVVLLFAQIEAGFRCPNSCSGHGRCDPENVCRCIDEYTAPDCSQRTCPNGTSWADKARGVADAHYGGAECSDRGLCNRIDGKCRCEAGFEGLACQRLTSSCGSFGIPSSMLQLYQFNTPNADISTYTTWDANALTGCTCSYGYTGPNCEMRMCPKGDDPLTPTTGNYKFRLSYNFTADDFHQAGVIKLRFYGFTTYMLANSTAAECATAMTGLPNLGTTSCERFTTPNSVNMLGQSNITFIVTVEKWPELPLENNIYYHSGSPSLDFVLCEGVTNSPLGVAAIGSTCIVDIVTDTSATLPEYEYCSGRGICDFALGNCQCFNAFHGGACSDYKLLTTKESSVGDDILSLSSSASLYNQSIVALSSTVQHEQSFDMFSVETGGNAIFAITDVGDVTTRSGSWTLGGSGGMTVHSFGLTLTGTAGATIGSAGLVVTGGVSVEDTGALTAVFIHAGGLTGTGGVSLGSLGLVVDAGGMEITGPSDRTVIIDAGGLHVTGGVENQYGGMLFKDGVSVAAGGFVLAKWGATIRSGGLTVTGGATVEEGIGLAGGMTVTTLGLVLTGGFNDLSPGLPLSVTGGMTVHDGSLIVTGGVTIHTGGFVLTTGAVTLFTGGLAVTGGMTVTDLDVKVGAGDITGNVATMSGGLKITGGLTVADTGIFASGGLTVSNLGLTITGGLTVSATGLTLTPGLTIHTGGLFVTTGLTLSTDGLLSAGGVVVKKGGLLLTSGLTVSDGGMSADGGLTVQDDGLVMHSLTVSGGGIGVTGGLTVASGAVKVTGGLSIRGAGLLTNGGLTVANGGMYVATTGVTVSTGGVVVTGGLSVKSAGLVASGGMTVNDVGFDLQRFGLTVSAGGVQVTGGLTVQNSGLYVTDTGISVKNGGMVTTVPLYSSLAPFYVYNKGLTVTGSVSIQSGGLWITQAGATIKNEGLKITGGLTVYGPATTANGMTVSNTGVSASSLTISSVGMDVDSLTIATGGLVSGAGLTVSGGGVVSAAALSLTDVGLFVADIVTTPLLLATGGLTIHNDNVLVTGGVSVDSAGVMLVSGGLTVASGGMFTSTGGVTVGEGGMVVEGEFGVKDQTVATGAVVFGGLTVTAGGMKVTHGLTVANERLLVTGGLTVVFFGLNMAATGTNNRMEVDSDGLVILDASPSYDPGGLTVNNNGMKIAAGGLTLGNAGAKVTGGLTVATTGLVVSGGSTVFLGGLKVAAGGLTVNGNINLETAYNVFSDRRLKQDITPIGGALRLVQAMRGVTYDFRAPSEVAEAALRKEAPPAPTRSVGVVAQELLSVLPEAVGRRLVNYTDSNPDADTVEMEQTEFLTVAYDSIIPVLVEAVKELDVKLRGGDSSGSRNTTGAVELSDSEISSLLAEIEEKSGLTQEEGQLLEMVRALLAQVAVAEAESTELANLWTQLHTSL